jgi:hypothetical protein
MLFAMVRSYEQRFGEKLVSRFLRQAPWRLLDLSSFKPHAQRLEKQVAKLRQMLPIPYTAADLANSLIEESFAYILGVQMQVAMTAGSRPAGGSRIQVADFWQPEEFIRGYILERAPGYVKQLDAATVKVISAPLIQDVDAMRQDMVNHLRSA